MGSRQQEPRQLWLRERRASQLPLQDVWCRAARRRALWLLRCAEVAPLLATSLPAGGGGGPRINLSKLQTASLKRYGAAYHLVRWCLLLAWLLARWLLSEELVQPR